MVFFTADLHFGHDNIIKLCNRPFENVREMDEALIANWNRKVKRNDTVYVVGDLVWQKNSVEDYLKRLNGNKILIVGNHDNWAKDEAISRLFVKITAFEEVSLNGHPITLCHYPLIEWKNSRKDGTSRLGYLIYGHIHNNVKPEYRLLFEKPNALNAGVEVNGFEPVTFDELLENNLRFSRSALSALDSQGENWS